MFLLTLKGKWRGNNFQDKLQEEGKQIQGRFGGRQTGALIIFTASSSSVMIDFYSRTNNSLRKVFNCFFSTLYL